MKKLFTILMSLLLVLPLTQCKPNNGKEDGGRKVKVRCEIPINNNGTRSDFETFMTDGSIMWSTGTERVYLALPNDVNPQIVELSAYSNVKANVLAFEGEVDASLLENGREYEVWYFGNSKNLNVPYFTETKEDDVIKSISGSIAEQSGQQTDLGYCHIAKTTVKAVVEDNEVVLPLRGILKSYVAIAYLDLEGVDVLNGDAVVGTEYTFQYNDDIDEFELVVSEDPDAEIKISNGSSTSHVILLPNENNKVVLKCSKGGYEFKKGVESNKFYYRFISDMEKATLRWENIEEKPQPNYNYVDLELPSGLLWAECNIGAFVPEDYGDYYAWGEIETKEVYNLQTSLTYGKNITDFSGNPTYDAAAANWGDDWRMPTSEEWYELIGKTNCTWAWTTQNGVNGYKVTSVRNGNSIFLPAAGSRGGTTNFDVGGAGNYISSSPDGMNTVNAWMLWFNQVSRSVDVCQRAQGSSIRPVKPGIPGSGGGGGGEVEVTLPTVTTNNASSVSATTATCGGNVTSDGGATTARGVYYGTNPNPETTGSKKAAGSGTGSFTCNLTDLTPNTTYYVKAYATNSEGTSYGEQKTFTTTSVVAPIVTTSGVSNVQATSATCGGNVTSDGGATVTARGICWSTSQNPTISNSKTSDGTGTGSFTSAMTGLTKNTTYYVRAYATNSVGTSYGEQKSFSTVANDTKSIVFAEGVSTSSGWYDVNKLKNGGGDINMCWAASASNIIQWWQDRYVAAGNSLPSGAVTGPGTKEYDGVGAYNLALMELYRDLWWNEKGGDTDHGIVWYFEGRNIQATASSGSHAQPNSSTSGGYFSSVWNQILPRIYKYDKIVVPGVVEYYDLISTEFNNYYIWGGGSGLSGEDRLKKFSELVEEFIGRGPASFVISLNSNGGLLHATTLWGYEIDNSTGMITKLWITDSDDMHQSGNGDPTVQMLREYSVSYDAVSGKVKLSGAPYGSCWAISLFPVSGYGTN